MGSWARKVRHLRVKALFDIGSDFDEYSPTPYACRHLWLAASAGFAQADEGRYVNENGITYYDTYRTVQRPVNGNRLSANHPNGV